MLAPKNDFEGIVRGWTEVEKFIHDSTENYENCEIFEIRRNSGKPDFLQYEIVNEQTIKIWI